MSIANDMYSTAASPSPDREGLKCTDATDLVPLPHAIVFLVESLVVGYSVLAVRESAFDWAVLEIS